MNTYKQLQAANLTSRAGRGRHASKVTARDCVLLLFALSGSEHIRDAVDAVRRYSTLEARYRQSRGDYAVNDKRSDSDTQWSLVVRNFPKLGNLPAGHSLLDAVETLVLSFADDLHSTNLNASVSVTMVGPQVRATVRISDQNGSEEIEYVTTSGADMFRTVVGNPEMQTKAFEPTIVDIHVSKTFTHRTLQTLGNLLREK